MSTDRSHTVVSPTFSDARNLPLTAVPVGDATVLVVIEKQSHFYLSTIRAASLESAQTIMEHVRAKREETIRQNELVKLFHDAFWKQGVNIATVFTRLDIDIEDQPVEPVEVIIRDPEPLPELTAGFRRPDLLDISRPFVEQYPDVILGAPVRKALLVNRNLHKQAVLNLAFVALLVAIVIGIVVGLVICNVGAGIQASVGIIGGIAVVVPLLAWATK